VALANIEVMESEGLVENARAMGALLHDGLLELVARHPIAGEARGLGLIQGLEIVDRGAEAPVLAGEVSLACLERGLIVGGLRPGLIEGNTLRLAPPLVVDERQVREALALLDEALTTVGARRQREPARAAA
jgi:4-aminobutyrate aminotransferase-like enzyme